jgi:hypothetical protein
MAKVDKRAPAGSAANGGGNSGTSNSPRVPPIAKKVPVPPTYKTTYGAGDGKGGPGVPANDGGNRKKPMSAGKIPMPTNYDSYNQSPK